MPKKRNEFRSGTVTGRLRSSQFASFSNYTVVGPLSFEQIESNNHHRLSGGAWSGGGPMFLTRDITSYSPGKITRFDGVGNLLTEGTARIEGVQGGSSPLGAPPHPSDLELDALGTTAIARTEPTSPAFDLSVFLGELRAEGLPNLPGTSVMERTKLAKSAGSEYLNVEFGWAPLVRGIRDFAKTVEQSDRITRSYQENANRAIKRHYEWPDLSDSRFTYPVSFTMQPAVGFIQGHRWESYLQRKWFEVEYIYHLPTGSAASDKFRRYGSFARKLYGIDLSPEVLWNLSPWSWAADWFGNVGDVMHNISALGQDGLVMRHGYMMCHTQKVVTDQGTFDGKFGRITPMYKHSVVETKSRRSATPFGFGVSFSGLSAKQVAIVSALGLSRW